MFDAGTAAVATMADPFVLAAFGTLTGGLVSFAVARSAIKSNEKHDRAKDLSAAVTVLEDLLWPPIMRAYQGEDVPAYLGDKADVMSALTRVRALSARDEPALARVVQHLVRTIEERTDGTWLVDHYAWLLTEIRDWREDPRNFEKRWRNGTWDSSSSWNVGKHGRVQALLGYTVYPHHSDNRGPLWLGRNPRWSTDGHPDRIGGDPLTDPEWFPQRARIWIPARFKRAWWYNVTRRRKMRLNRASSGGRTPGR
ncbi:hypothetical protein [Luteipulveratus mongoliensis]|uniref:Uncharacterized protein n=1 Tax=Luteipulveratus mongoliensis TaxID=571913 RepID=A0A0K1JML5_9MICO|nr:hypothetical protein [Luteipulveratus mongoliensis]AKU17956.1 hypothetical protein VV02_22315 [Luteipulveratus mongoliensis]